MIHDVKLGQSSGKVLPARVGMAEKIAPIHILGVILGDPGQNFVADERWAVILFPLPVDQQQDFLPQPLLGRADAGGRYLPAQSRGGEYGQENQQKPGNHAELFHRDYRKRGEIPPLAFITFRQYI